MCAKVQHGEMTRSVLSNQAIYIPAYKSKLESA